jgi:hypothetical protein
MHHAVKGALEIGAAGSEGGYVGGEDFFHLLEHGLRGRSYSDGSHGESKNGDS